MNGIKLNSIDIIDPAIEVHYMLMTSFKEIYTQPHSHDFYEFFLILDGEIHHTVNQTVSNLKKGDLVFIRPNDTHQYKKVKSKDCQLMNIAIDRAAIHSLFNYLGSGFQPERLLNTETPPTIKLSNHEFDHLTTRIQLLNETHYDNTKLIKTEWRILLVELFIRYFKATPNNKTEYPEWINTTIEQMKKPENLKAGLPHLNAISGKSKEHTCRSFVKHLNQTPSEFIHETRLKTAANQLTSSDKKIALIAKELGYNDVSYFYQQFKKYYKQNPGDFRRLHHKSIIPMIGSH